MLSRLPDLFSPAWLPRLHTFSIVAGAAILLGLIVIVMAIIGRSTQSTSEASIEAIQAVQAESELGALLATLNARTAGYLASAEFAGLSPADQAAVRADLARSDLAIADTALPPVELRLSLAVAASFQRRFDLIEKQFGSLFASEDELETVTIQLATRGAATALESYFVSPTVERFRVLRQRLDNLRFRTNEAVPVLVAQANSNLSQSIRMVDRIQLGRSP